MKTSLSDFELKGGDAIKLTVPDTHTPIVMLVGGPISSPLVLSRMAYWLHNNGLYVRSERTFRPKEDMNYARRCAEFDEALLFGEITYDFIMQVSFMLANVSSPSGKPICQFLQVPVTHYFSYFPSCTSPLYFNELFALPNRKVWLLFVELDKYDGNTYREMYAQMICNLQAMIPPRDKVVFLFDKVEDPSAVQYDRTERFISSAYFANISRQYPGIFEKYRNKGLKRVLLGEYGFKVACFSAGMFYKTYDGRNVLSHGDDRYCERLWKALNK